MLKETANETYLFGCNQFFLGMDNKDIFKIK